MSACWGRLQSASKLYSAPTRRITLGLIQGLVKLHNKDSLSVCYATFLKQLHNFKYFVLIYTGVDKNVHLLIFIKLIVIKFV